MLRSSWETVSYCKKKKNPPLLLLIGCLGCCLTYMCVINKRLGNLYWNKQPVFGKIHSLDDLGLPTYFCSSPLQRNQTTCLRVTPLPMERHTFHIIIVVTGLSGNLAQNFWQPPKREPTVSLAGAELRRRRSCVVLLPKG